MNYNIPNQFQYPQAGMPNYQQQAPTSDVEIGQIRIKDMITINTYGPGIVILITWAISTYNGDTIPWPVMITDTASYYPQNILFRIGLLVPLFYWCIAVLLVKWWLRSAELTVYGLGGAPFYLEVVGYVSVICYGITISTIDQGQTATHLHGACAVIFLALQMVYEISTTIVLHNIRQLNPQFISQWSMDRKILLCYVWVIPVVALIYEAIYDNKYGIALAEWVAVFTVIFYIQSFGDDLRHYELTIDDEGFQLSDLKRRIGYAEAYCVDEQEQGESNSHFFESRNAQPQLGVNNSFSLTQNFVAANEQQMQQQQQQIHYQNNNRNNNYYSQAQEVPVYSNSSSTSSHQVEMKSFERISRNIDIEEEENKNHNNNNFLPQIAMVQRDHRQLPVERNSNGQTNQYDVPLQNNFSAFQGNSVGFLDPKTGILYVNGKPVNLQGAQIKMN